MTPRSPEERAHGVFRLLGTHAGVQLEAAVAQALRDAEAARDAEWATAYALAIGPDSGLTAPLTPEAVHRCLASLQDAVAHPILQSCRPPRGGSNMTGPLILVGSPKRDAGGKLSPEWFGYVQMVGSAVAGPGSTTCPHCGATRSEYKEGFDLAWLSETLYLVPESLCQAGDPRTAAAEALKAGHSVRKEFEWSEDPGAPWRVRARAYWAAQQAYTRELDAVRRAARDAALNGVA